LQPAPQHALISVVTPQLASMHGPSNGHSNGGGYAVIARLKPGVTLAQAHGEMVAIAARLATAYPQSNREIGATVRGFQPMVLIHELKIRGLRLVFSAMHQASLRDAGCSRARARGLKPTAKVTPSLRDEARSALRDEEGALRAKMWLMTSLASGY
jgi:hypothetical protein